MAIDDEHWVVYGPTELLYCTSETNKYSIFTTLELKENSLMVYIVLFPQHTLCNSMDRRHGGELSEYNLKSLKFSLKANHWRMPYTSSILYLPVHICIISMPLSNTTWLKTRFPHHFHQNKFLIYIYLTPTALYLNIYCTIYTNLLYIISNL